MPNPATLHHRSIKIDHHLKLVDWYIKCGCPEVFHVEPNWKEYKPDVYMKDLKGNPICVEVQLTPISSKKIATKIEQFVSSYGKEHDARVMFLVSNTDYKFEVPSGFNVIPIPLPFEPYAQ